MDKTKEKQEIVSAYLSGGTSTRKLGLRYGYNHVTIGRWVMAHKKQLKKQSLEFSKKALMHRELSSDVAELQEALRLSRIRVELLEAMIDISDEQFGTDIRKKAGTSQS